MILKDRLGIQTNTKMWYVYGKWCHNGMVTMSRIECVAIYVPQSYH